jgi:serine/threonine protein kinase
LRPERWQQISRIFKSAISLDDEARAAYVADQCGSDDVLRADVEKLIDSHQRASKDNFIGGVAAEAGAKFLIDRDNTSAPHKTLTEGQQFGSYMIVSRLGAGGMGEVYLARDARLDRIVALKVLSEDVTLDKRRMQRFRQEARVASSLNQPNILTVFEFGEVEGLNFLATEFIDGETLRNYISGKNQLRLGEILEISIQVLAALDAAHEAHIVHRDIKPENVMIRSRDRVVKVLDFGLAKVSEKKGSTSHEEESEAATAVKTAPGIIMGTINYMSPEQARGDAIDERTDIWSTGVMIYEMVAGALPFAGETTSHTIVQILEKDPVPLTRVAEAPVELERIVLKAMAKSRDERYQTAKDMRIDLRSLKKRLDVEAEIQRTSSPTVVRATQETDLGSQKRRVLVIALIGMALVTAGIFAVNIWRSQHNVPVATSTAPAAERTLTYWITVQKYSNDKPYQEPFVLAGEINFEANYRIRVSVRSPQTGYLYIFNEGPAAGQPEYNIVFPSPTANKGSSHVLADQLVQIPEESWLKFDEQRGVEKLWLVFSEDAVPELESARQFASRQTGGAITDAAQNRAVQNFLTMNSANKPQSEKGDSLTVVKSPGKLLVYPIRLEHH